MLYQDWCFLSNNLVALHERYRHGAISKYEGEYSLEAINGWLQNNLINFNEHQHDSMDEKLYDKYSTLASNDSLNMSAKNDDANTDIYHKKRTTTAEDPEAEERKFTNYIFGMLMLNVHIFAGQTIKLYKDGDDDIK